MEIDDKVYLTEDIEDIKGGIRAVISGKYTSIIDGSVTYTIFVKSFDRELTVLPTQIASYNNPHTGTLFSEVRF